MTNTGLRKARGSHRYCGAEYCQPHCSLRKRQHRQTYENMQARFCSRTYPFTYPSRCTCCSIHYGSETSTHICQQRFNAHPTGERALEEDCLKFRRVGTGGFLPLASRGLLRPLAKRGPPPRGLFTPSLCLSLKIGGTREVITSYR
jgi:hypothetical protein